MMTIELATNATVVVRYNFRAVVVYATSVMVRRSEFGFGDNERIGSGKLFHCSVHEFIHTVLSFKLATTMRGKATHIS